MSTKEQPFTTQVATNELNRRRSQRPPELQLHASATLVSHGDPLAITKEERLDLAGEVAQFCVPIESKWVGRLKRHHIDQAFVQLKESLLTKLRQAGVMAAGE